MLGILVLAAVLEVGGDAAIRHGLTRASWPWMALGVLALGAYGFAVNGNRVVDFGRLMGLYIVIFFVTSQVLAGAIFGERPTPSRLAAGALIVLGGIVLHLGRTR